MGIGGKTTSEAPAVGEANAVIVFADIVGCSRISDALGLRDYAQFIHEFHETATQAASVVFRAPTYAVPREFELSIRGDEACVIIHRDPRDDVQHAILFAVTLQLLWLTGGYNRQRLAKGALPVEVGIGIHAGAVYIDLFQHAHATSEGYSINVAKRIEGRTRKGHASKIMLSSQACSHLAPEDLGLSFAMTPFEPISIRGVGGAFVLHELVDVDESLLLDLELDASAFDEQLLKHLAFVSGTRVDAEWLHVLSRVAFGIAHGKEALFRHLLSKQTDTSRTSTSWFMHGIRERERGDANMAVLMFELAASAATGQNKVVDARDQKAWAFYNAALAHEDRGAFAASIDSYQKAVRLRPAYVQYQFGLVAGYMRAERAKEALTFLYEIRDEVVGDQQRAAALLLEALCLERLGESKSAAECRSMVEDTYGLKLSSVPTLEMVLKRGTDAGALMLKAGETAKYRPIV